MFALQHFDWWKMKNINKTEWLKLVKNDRNAVIIDVRTPRECAKGIIENARMIDFLDAPKFKSEIEKLANGKVKLDDTSY